jgi:hypothetical protein
MLPMWSPGLYLPGPWLSAATARIPPADARLPPRGPRGLSLWHISCSTSTALVRQTGAASARDGAHASRRWVLGVSGQKEKNRTQAARISRRLIRANHSKGWDAKLLAYVPHGRDTVAELPGAHSTS